MSDEMLYAQALAEAREGVIQQDLNAKAYVLAKGDPAQQEIEYLRLRVQQLKTAAITAQLEPDNVIRWFKLLLRWVFSAFLIYVALLSLVDLLNRQSYQPADFESMFHIGCLIFCPLIALKLCWPSMYKRL